MNGTDDNKLMYKFAKPAKPLADFVHDFSMIKNMYKINEIVLIPNARVDLFFVKETDDQFRIELVGLETKPNKMAENNHEVMFRVSFNPLAAEYILGYSIADILDSKKTLRTNFWNFNIQDLNDFDTACNKVSEKIHSLSPSDIDERKRKLFELIFATDGEISVKEISEQVFWSARQINHYFNQQFGLSLKMYCNIFRFQASLSHLKQGQLFPQLNYYDQSHFIKEVKRFSGASPKELFKNENNRFLQFLAAGIK